ncbi:MAG TPA: HAD-IIIC family phosphatase [Candidatus Acidoferrales bacterium]|nr:HAD-IIIC family phosphatase [Candidatus Acidoferrales bacterium]
MPQPDIRNTIDTLIAAGDAPGAARALAQAWEAQASAAFAGFVASRFDRLRPHLPLVPYRWAVVRSFTVEPVLPIFKANAYAHGIALDLHAGEFNAYAQEILDPESSLYRFRPDALVLAVQTRDAGDVSTLLGRFADWIAAFRRHSSAALIVHSLEVPAPGSGILDAQREDGETEAVRAINRGLVSMARQHHGVYILDYDALVARHGRAGWADERKWLTVRLPIASAHLTHLAAEWMRFLHPLTGKLAKCIAVDLDNTLWGGVVGEDGMTGIKLSQEFPGAAFQAVQRALLDFAKRGILLAVASKNNLADAMEALTSHPGMLLKPRDFAAMRINWNDKAQSLREIAAELNIGLDSIAFVDDNPVERRHVRENAPDAIVIELPQDPMGIAQCLRDCPWFERLTLSDEDRKRGEYYAAQRERAELQSSVASKEDFYRSLEQVVEIARVTPATLERVAQLTQKTNQFNLTTRRYTGQQISEMAACPGWRVWSLRVTDRYADNGLVGVAITHLDGGVCEIDTFLMSCRVIGRTVETALLARIADDARSSGAGRLQGWFLPTKKNTPAQDFYREHGFSEAERTAEGTLFAFDLSQDTIPTPEWIRVA